MSSDGAQDMTTTIPAAGQQLNNQVTPVCLATRPCKVLSQMALSHLIKPQIKTWFGAQHFQ